MGKYWKQGLNSWEFTLNKKSGSKEQDLDEIRWELIMINTKCQGSDKGVGNEGTLGDESEL